MTQLISKEFALGIGIVAVSLLSAEAAWAGEPEQELSSGPYISRTLASDYFAEPRTALSIGEFSPRLHTNISGITDQIYFECSPAQGLVSNASYSGFSDYIRSALIEQLQDADRYVAEALVQLSGELQKVELYFDSLVGESLSQGTWEIQLTLRSSLGGEETFTVNHSYPISSRSNYCHEMANQFMISVQSLMVEILGSSRFAALIRPAGIS
ncbi:MAG: hypothetical protein KJN90_09265 [Gammaproteobacteria bacterium]|nr:hypothetical protein [Gammaproteobacteria bacterium]